MEVVCSAGTYLKPLEEGFRMGLGVPGQKPVDLTKLGPKSGLKGPRQGKKSRTVLRPQARIFAP